MSGEGKPKVDLHALVNKMTEQIQEPVKINEEWLKEIAKDNRKEKI